VRCGHTARDRVLAHQAGQPKRVFIEAKDVALKSLFLSFPSISCECNNMMPSETYQYNSSDCYHGEAQGGYCVGTVLENYEGSTPHKSPGYMKYGGGKYSLSPHFL
jgi:hypothetical protein